MQLKRQSVEVRQNEKHYSKGNHTSENPMPRQERTCQANQAGENSSFIFTVCVKSVPHYHFKLAYVILQMAVKEFSKTTSKNVEIGRFN